VRKKYQTKDQKSNQKFEVVRGQELMVQVPLPMAGVWAEMQAQVEELTGQAGLQILRAILENEVTRRVGPPHRPHPTAGCVGRKSRWNGHGYERGKARKWNCRATVNQHNACALRGEKPDGCLTQPAARARDDHDFPFDIIAHSMPFICLPGIVRR
jgi:hypothetical protein